MALTNFSWVIPDKLAGSDIPGNGTGDERQIREDIGFLAWQGIGCLISLEHPGGAIAQICGESGMQWRYFSVPDFGVPVDLPAFAALVDDCIALFTAGTAVCVHCRAGVGRTGLLLSCITGRYLHLSGPKAVAAVRSVRPAIETGEQESFIASFLSDYEY